MRRRFGDGRRGFSLVETVLALGIVGFAVVAIVGLLPLAVQSARESMVETDATLIARRIHSELSVGTGANRIITANDLGDTIPINLATGSTNTIWFDQSGAFSSSTAAAYAVFVMVATNTDASNLSQIQIAVASPANVPVANRTTNAFTTLMHYSP